MTVSFNASLVLTKLNRSRLPNDLVLVGKYILATAMFFIHPLIKAKRRS